ASTLSPQSQGSTSANAVPAIASPRELLAPAADGGRSARHASTLTTNIQAVTSVTLPTLAIWMTGTNPYWVYPAWNHGKPSSPAPRSSSISSQAAGKLTPSDTRDRRASHTASPQAAAGKMARYAAAATHAGYLSHGTVIATSDRSP